MTLLSGGLVIIPNLVSSKGGNWPNLVARGSLPLWMTCHPTQSDPASPYIFTFPKCQPIYIHFSKMSNHIYSPLKNTNPYIRTFKQFQPIYIFTFPKWWWQCSIQAMFNISAHIHLLPKIGQMFAHFCKFSNVCNVFNFENLTVAVSPLWKRGSSPQSCSVTMPLILSNCLTLA